MKNILCVGSSPWLMRLILNYLKLGYNVRLMSKEEFLKSGAGGHSIERCVIDEIYGEDPFLEERIKS